RRDLADRRQILSRGRNRRRLIHSNPHHDYVYAQRQRRRCPRAQGLSYFTGVPAAISTAPRQSRRALRQKIRMSLRVSTKYIPLLATALVLIVLYTLGCVSFENFGSVRVLVNLLGDNAFLGVAAIGATFVILSGGIDLSVGSVV